MTVKAVASPVNFGRDIEINLAYYEARPGGEFATIGYANNGTIEFKDMESLTEGQQPPQPEEPTLRLRHDLAQALYESLYRIYGPVSVPRDVATQEALAIERRRVDRLIDVALDGS